ncbi:hypothetical protein PUN28_020861 [Cardiocondyla obscurior]|uniref:BED-type domain-containing protein n=1 Tax=Cardiocondyla obscurior TaxID=286306 RepID=A0AAW2E5B9_9HYME
MSKRQHSASDSDSDNNDVNDSQDLLASSSTSTPKRTKLSIYYNVDVDDKKEKFGVCKLCKEQKVKKIIKMNNSNITGLKRHLKIAHKKEFDKLYDSFP